MLIVTHHALQKCYKFHEISKKKKRKHLLLLKKKWPTLLIALTTASSAAAFATNTKDSTTKLGIDKKLVDFGIPVGQILFNPGYFALLFGISIGLADSLNMIDKNALRKEDFATVDTER